MEPVDINAELSTEVDGYLLPNALAAAKQAAG